MSWPVGGYAPGGYSFRCVDCGGMFYEGDKRATQCLPCAIEGLKSATLVSSDELQVIRSWVVYAATTNALPLNEDDYLLARRIYRALGMPLPGWLIQGLAGSEL